MTVIQKRLWAGLQAGGFIILTLVGWWVFASLGAGVVSCVPWNGQFACAAPFPDRPRLDTAVRIFTLFVSLCAAIWLGNRAFYTPDTYEPKDPAPKPVSDEDAAAEKVRDVKESPTPHVVGA
jgi:hypothetical protein